MKKITPEQKFKNARAKKVLSAPVIDMERLLFDSKENEKLYEALVNAGFLYLSNHGIDFFNNVRKMNQRVVACDEFDRVFDGENRDESKRALEEFTVGIELEYKCDVEYV